MGDLVRQEIEFAAVEEDPSAEVVEGSESSGGGLEGLDFAVESFAHGIGDPMSEVGQEVGQMAFEGLGDFHHRAAVGCGPPNRTNEQRTSSRCRRSDTPRTNGTAP